jgi:hypothetical protein
MKTLAEWLREGDPLAHTPEPSEPEVAAMRRRVIGAAAEPPVRPLVWPKVLAVATVVMLMAVAGASSRRRAPSHAADLPSRPHAGEHRAMPRQLQFATPGGTRIIWTFDPDFSLKESAP